MVFLLDCAINGYLSIIVEMLHIVYMVLMLFI